MNRELQDILEYFKSLKLINLRESKYLDPTSILYDNSVYLIDSKPLCSLIGNSFGFLNYSTNKSLYKMSPELWRSYVEGNFSNKVENLDINVYADDDKIVSLTPSELSLPIIEIIDHFNSNNYIAKIYYNTEDRLDFFIKRNSEDLYSIGVVYYIDQNFLKLYSIFDIEYQNKLYKIIPNKPLYSKYTTDSPLAVVDMIEEELSSNNLMDYVEVLEYEIEESLDTLTSGISIDELFSNLSNWLSMKFSNELLNDSEFIQSLPDERIVSMLELFKMKDTDIPDNKLKRSVEFSSIITYGDVLKLAESLLEFRVINITQYVDFLSSILNGKTNWDYLK